MWFRVILATVLLAVGVFFGLDYYGDARATSGVTKFEHRTQITDVHPRGRVIYVSFAHGKLFETKARENHQHVAPQVDATRLFLAADLDPSFVERNHTLLTTVKEGYGWWVWKPQVIKQAWDEADIGDVILYADGGVKFIDSVSKWADMCRTSASGVVAAAFRPYAIRRRVKGDIYHAANVGLDDAVGDYVSPEATHVLFHKRTSQYHDLLAEWGRLCETPHMLDPEHSVQPNPKGYFPFMAMHDQSILALLLWKHHADIVDCRNNVPYSKLKDSFTLYRLQRSYARRMIRVKTVCASIFK